MGHLRAPVVHSKRIVVLHKAPHGKHDPCEARRQACKFNSRWVAWLLWHAVAQQLNCSEQWRTGVPLTVEMPAVALSGGRQRAE